MLLIILLAGITLFAAWLQGFSFWRMYKYVDQELKNRPSDYDPRVAVILPCKGVDSGFEENLERLLAQDYPNTFEIVFAVASENDPAYPVLKRVCERSPTVPTTLVVSGFNHLRGQKINNQLAALNHISDKAEVIVFVDSDVIARKDFLLHLVAHLQDPTVGVTTGYRFYIPIKGDPMSLMRSLWNRMSAWELASPKYAFAWGGAMAIRTNTFARLRIREIWDRAADDDLSLTKAVKTAGLQVRFVPQCLVASQGDGTVANIIEWTNRQLILTKVYYPELWMKAMVQTSILTFWLLAVLTSFILAASGDRQSLQAGFLGLSLLFLEACFLQIGQKLWYRVLTHSQGQPHLEMQSTLGSNQASTNGQARSLIEFGFSRPIWQWALILPLAHIVLPWMTLYSLLTNRIKWRGVTYDLRSPTETIVVGL